MTLAINSIRKLDEAVIMSNNYISYYFYREGDQNEDNICSGEVTPHFFVNIEGTAPYGKQGKKVVDI